jgi:hypothetical protein
MEKEYNFSNGIRGKFFHKETTLHIPIYLEADNQAFLEEIAKKKNSDVSTLVNKLIKSDRKIADLIQ